MKRSARPGIQKEVPQVELDWYNLQWPSGILPEMEGRGRPWIWQSSVPACLKSPR